MSSNKALLDHRLNCHNDCAICTLSGKKPKPKNQSLWGTMLVGGVRILEEKLLFSGS